MRIVWQDITIPDFRVERQPGKLPASIYQARCQKAYAKTSCDWLVVYGDREHSANLAYLNGFDPRFEEAALPASRLSGLRRGKS